MKSTVIVLILLILEPYHDSFCFLVPVQTKHADAKHVKFSLNLRRTPSLCLIHNARNVHSDVAQKKIQISAVWSESSLSTWRNFASLAGLGLRCSHMACGPFYHVTVLFCVKYEPKCGRKHTCASKEDSNQLAHTRSLIRVIVVRMQKFFILDFSIYAQRMRRLIGIFAGRFQMLWFNCSWMVLYQGPIVQN